MLSELTDGTGALVLTFTTGRVLRLSRRHIAIRPVEAGEDACVSRIAMGYDQVEEGRHLTPDDGLEPWNKPLFTAAERHELAQFMSNLWLKWGAEQVEPMMLSRLETA